MDILSVTAIRLPCSWCGENYLVPLRDILRSHEILHEGCPVAEETECPPVFQVRLASESAVRALDQAWRRMQRRAEADGGELVLMNRLQPHAASEQEGSPASVRVSKRKSRRGRAA